MYKNCFCTGGGPWETSGKHDASCDVILSKGNLLWKAAPSSPVSVNVVSWKGLPVKIIPYRECPFVLSTFKNLNYLPETKGIKTSNVLKLFWPEFTWNYNNYAEI